MRLCTYVSHSNSHEVMFPWHQPEHSIGVFHHRTMRDEEGRERGGGDAGRRDKTKVQTQISKPPGSNSRKEVSLYQHVN